MTRPAENQQTVEALARTVRDALWADATDQEYEEALDALRGLAAQASAANRLVERRDAALSDLAATARAVSRDRSLWAAANSRERDRLVRRVAELEQERDSALSRMNIAESHASLLRGKLAVLEAAARVARAAIWPVGDWEAREKAAAALDAALAGDGGGA